MLVVKIGGAQGIAHEKVCQDIKALVYEGNEVVVVHGGSAMTNEISEKLGCPPQFVTSPSGFTSRFTDRKTLEIFAMVTNGMINTLLVECLQKNGVNAFGMSGLDGKSIQAKRKDKIRVIENGKQRILRGDYTGKINHVETGLIKSLLWNGLVPVVSPLAISEAGEALNVDADRAASSLAAALEADSLVLLSNVPGLMSNFPDESTLIHHVPRHDLENAMSVAQGRMKKKVLGAAEALEQGVSRVIFGDARGETPLQSALAGEGTIIS